MLKAYSFLSIVVAFTLLLCLPIVSKAQAPASPPATPAAPAPQSQADEIAGAKTLVRQLAQTKVGDKWPELLTNRSAAVAGLGFFYLCFGADGTQVDNDPSVIAAGTELSKRYGVVAPDKKGNLPDAFVKRLESHGRAFLSDVLAACVKTGTDTSGFVSDPNSSWPSSHASDYIFTVISPSDVRVRIKNKSGNPFEARWEDGMWRADFGGWFDLLTKAKPIKVPESIFYPQESFSRTGMNGMNTIGFTDNYTWGIPEHVRDFQDGTTDKGREMEAGIGEKADYYHILNTNLIAVKPHGKEYRRMGALDDAIRADDISQAVKLVAATPRLVNAQFIGKLPLERAVFFRHNRMLKFLIRQGAIVNAVDSFYQSALLEAVELNNTGAARILLRAGANPNSLDPRESSLPIAVKAHYSAMAVLLKQYGAK